MMMVQSGDDVQGPISSGTLSAKQSNHPSFKNTAQSTMLNANNRQVKSHTAFAIASQPNSSQNKSGEASYVHQRRKLVGNERARSLQPADANFLENGEDDEASIEHEPQTDASEIEFF